MFILPLKMKEIEVCENLGYIFDFSMLSFKIKFNCGHTTACCILG